MKISEMQQLLEARVLCCEENIEHDIHSACGCDLMSDVLAFVKEQAVLLSGLVNPQVIRTAEMMDMKCIVFVRGKKPSIDMIDLATERDIVLLRSDLEMFTACGLLYKNGLKGGSGI